MSLTIKKSYNEVRPIYTTENFWHGSDTNGTGAEKCKILLHLHVSFSIRANHSENHALVGCWAY